MSKRLKNKFSSESERKKTATNSLTIGDRPWHKNLLAFGAIFGLGVAIWNFAFPFFTPDPVEINILILVDTSRDTSEKFDGVTKADAVQTALDKAFLSLSSSDNIALRQFGGGCINNTSKTVVKFATNNQQSLKSAITNLTYSGDRPLITGLVEATGDFNDSRRFSGRKNRIVAITSGEDTCYLDFETGSELRERLKLSGISTDFYLIGVGIPLESQNKLKNLAESVSGKVKFVNSQKELQETTHNFITGKDIISDGMRANVKQIPSESSVEALPLIQKSTIEDAENRKSTDENADVKIENVYENQKIQNVKKIKKAGFCNSNFSGRLKLIKKSIYEINQIDSDFAMENLIKPPKINVMSPSFNFEDFLYSFYRYRGKSYYLTYFPKNFSYTLYDLYIEKLISDITSVFLDIDKVDEPLFFVARLETEINFKGGNVINTNYSYLKMNEAIRVRDKEVIKDFIEFIIENASASLFFNHNEYGKFSAINYWYTSCSGQYVLSPVEINE